MKNVGENNLMEKIVSLCKRRGFIFPGSEIYGGLANSWDYGPLGVELKNNIKQLWWKRFVQSRDDMVGIDAAIIMNPKVWEASGHLKEFSDPMVECRKCHARFRADWYESADKELTKKLKSAPKGVAIGSTINLPACENCGGKDWTFPKKFNLLFKTFLGATEDSSATAYLRGEIAQAMFVNFKQVLDSSRVRVPFGIAAQGRTFRNEITPGNFIFRTREFDLMELEYFVRAAEWEKWFEYWRKAMWDWITEDLGINKKNVHEAEIEKDELAHYSKRTIDFEYDYPFGRKELYGLAYRTDFDLKNHMEKSGQDLNYTDPDSGEKFIPHVIEPTFGLDRSLLATLLDSYHEEKDPAHGGASRVVLKLHPKLAPYKAAVFPLLANKPELVKKARQIYDELRKDPPAGGMVAWDERGNIGKRYYSQDEIGTPYCITVDFDTLGESGKENRDTITVRDRDSAKQERLAIKDLPDFLCKKLS